MSAAPILNQAQAAAICAAMRALNPENITVDRMCVGLAGEGMAHASCTHGAVSIWISRGRSGHGNELASERHPSQWEFAIAYGLPTDGLMPF